MKQLITFTVQEKADCFEQISKIFYNTNFGQASKTEVELLMFKFYFEKLVKSSQTSTGNIDYNACSDYKISKKLGITQQRVRNMKIRKQLVYPVDYDWQKELSILMDNARYDEKLSKITVSIPDPNLFYDIQNFIEELGGYIDIQLNSKILQIRAEYFLALVVAVEKNQKNQKNIEKRIKKEFIEYNKSEKGYDSKNIGKSLLEITTNVTSIVASISEIISPSNFLGVSLIKLLGLK